MYLDPFYDSHEGNLALHIYVSLRVLLIGCDMLACDMLACDNCSVRESFMPFFERRERYAYIFTVVQ